MTEVNTIEQAVRDTLAHRPAGQLSSLSRQARTTFSGLFNGASPEGRIGPKGGLKIGKAECEWHWPEAWDELQAAELISYRTEERPHHPSIGGSRVYVLWGITPKGRTIRNDDLLWYRELMDALEKDEAKPTIGFLDPGSQRNP